MVDITSGGANNNKKPQAKPFLGIMFECCNMYARIYRNKEGTHYEGRCPKCGRPLKVKIGDGGTGQRFFRAH